MRENSTKDQRSKKRFQDFISFFTPKKSDKGGKSNRQRLDEQQAVQFGRQGATIKSGSNRDFAAARRANAGDPGVGGGRQMVSGAGNPLLTAIDMVRAAPSVMGAARPPAGLPPVAPPAEGGGGEDLLGMQLAALGAGPDKAAYLKPFEEAEARARQAHGEALPVIASAYDTLRSKLGAGQQDFAGEQARVASEQQARAAQLSDNVRRLQAPALADVQAQSGGGAAPSLTAGVIAQATQNEANLTDAQRRQGAFLDNLARTSEQSHTSRLTDTHAAQQAASQNASFNLDQILGQLGMQRANAERQYGADVQSHGQERANVMRDYVEQQRRAVAEAEKEEAAAVEEEERRATGADKLRRHVGKTGAVFGAFAKQNQQLSQRYPKHFKALGELIGIDYEPGELGRASAHAVVDMNRDGFTGPDAVERYGASLKPERLHELIDLYYSQEEGLMLPFLAAGVRR